MVLNIARVGKPLTLWPLDIPEVSPAVSMHRASYLRRIPAHYAGNPHIREIIDLNVLLVDGGSLVVPASPQASFRAFFEGLKNLRPELFRQILSPSGAAKAASTDHLTPIKEIMQMQIAGQALPGDAALYGWQALAAEASQKALALQLFFQGNGLYFNRGSAFYNGEELLAFPDMFLDEILAEHPSAEMLQHLAVNENSLKRPLLFFVTQNSGKMRPYLHTFHPEETYRQGMKRLERIFQKAGVRAALAASPPLVIPDQNNNPRYLSLPEILGQFHTNDVRHSLYCPYQGAVLLSAELGRVQCLEPVMLARAFEAGPRGRVRMRLAETLRFISPPELLRALENKGYSRRYAYLAEESLYSEETKHMLTIRPLEGVYSHLVPFLTRRGRFGILQTSGTRGNITGNDGPTYRQLSAILRDLNSQPLFETDPIIVAASGSQGNDVPNVVCANAVGQPGLLHALAPQTLLDDTLTARGTVTTPRVGIAVPQG